MTPSRAPSLDLEREATLDVSFTFRPPARSLPRKILLTGATGQVGAHLLEALLELTEAQIVCLVRGRSDDDASARLWAQQEKLGLPTRPHARRVSVVVGDLALPMLGLPEERWSTLAEEVDTLHHCGGYVNFLWGYERLRPTNVGGVLEMLRLAAAGRPKALHYVSSLAIFFSSDRDRAQRLTEEEEVHFDPTLKGGYRQTKWVADRLVGQALQRGLGGAIYRPARITGHSRTGATADLSDLLLTLLRACVLMEARPELDIGVPMVPVDYVARGVAQLSLDPRGWGGAYHLLSEGDLPWSELWEIFAQLGHPARALPWERWLEELDARATAGPEGRPFMVLRRMLEGPNNLLYERPPLDNRRAREGLAAAGISCPPPDRGLLTTYVRYLEGVGFLPPPSLAAGGPR